MLLCIPVNGNVDFDKLAGTPALWRVFPGQVSYSNARTTMSDTPN